LRRFNRPRANRTDRHATTGSISRGGQSCRRAIFCALLLVIACAGTHGGDGRFEPGGDASCRLVDSVFDASGWREPMEMTGRVQLDVKQYRVQGRFRSTFKGDGDFTFEFTGTMAMGGHHEDVVVSFHQGRLYVLDRERGRFYEGDETNELIQEGLGMDWDMVALVRRITAWPPPCRRLSRLVLDSKGKDAARLEGRVDGESFRADFEGGRITRASWPVISEGRAEDRLSLDYRWRQRAAGPAALDELVAFLEGRRWRMILETN
jgi:hypothetical protein